MEENQTGWTKSQVTAFPYIQKAVADGLSANEGLRQYSAGGGAIRRSLWLALFKEEFSYNGVRDNVKQIPMTYTVPETMFEPVDYDFRETYVMQMKVKGYSQEIGQSITKWVTVESEELVTKKEWVYGAQQAITDTLGSPELVISEVVEWVPFKKSGVVHL